MEESNYYPFGLKHIGYNNVLSSLGNSTAKKFGYNGVELEEGLGLNLMEMEFRLYDPAIARFNGIIDPVTHFSQGTSVAFDNNPIYWADPSGADSDIYDHYGQRSRKKTGVDWSGFDLGPSHNDSGNADEDHIVNENENEAYRLRDSWNEIFLNKFGETPFSVEKVKKTRKVKVKSGGWFGEDEYKEEEYYVYKITGSIGFNWEQHEYTRMLRDILESPQEVTVDIMDGARGRELMKSSGGGKIMDPNRIELSNLCIDNCATNKKRIHWTIGGVALHELLWHLHPQGGAKYTGNFDGELHTKMRKYFKTKIKYGNARAHRNGDRQNIKINGTRFKK